MRLRRWLAILSVCALLTGLFSQVALAATAGQRNITVDEAVSYLKKYGIVVGDPSGDMRLGDPITRAELVKILVAALGQEQQALVLRGAAAFPDTQNHWASGYIAVARNMNLATGYPDGSFRPQNNVTNAEVLAFLCRAVGVALDQSLDWPESVIRPAVEAGIVPPEVDIRSNADVAATRAGVFLLAHRAFLLVKGSDGKNVYQRYWDREAPTLTMDEVPEVTADDTVTISGKAAGAVEVRVNDQAVSLQPDGSFRTEVALELGSNQITVVALDEVGNATARTLTVARSAGEPAAIEAPDTVTVKVGESRKLDIVVKDANGFTIPDPDLSAEVSDGIGTFDPDTLTFTAGEKTGVGTLTLKAGKASARITVTVVAGDVAKVVVTTDKESVAVGEQLKATAKAYDAAGNEIAGLPVLFSVTGSGALIDPHTGVFASFREGVYTIKATIGSVTGEVKVGVYGDPVDLEIEGPKEIVGNGKGAGPFRVKVVDANGALVAGDEMRVVELDSDTGDLVFVDENGNPLVNNQLTLRNGVATFYVKAGAELWGVIAEIEATDVDDDDFSDSISVEIVEQEPAAVAVVRQDEYIATNADGSTAAVYLAVVDQSGAEMLDGAWDIEWSIKGPAVEAETEEKSGVITYFGGEGPAELLLVSEDGDLGEVTVTATADGLGTATAKLTATVVGKPSRVKLTVNQDNQPVAESLEDSKGVEVTVTVTDSKGVPVPYTGEVVVTFSRDIADVEAADDSEQEIFAEDAAGGSGFDRVRVEFDDESRRTFRFVGTRAGEYSLTAEAPGLESATAKATLKAGPAARAGFTSKGILVAITNRESQATVQLMDDYGNPVAQAGVAITLQARSSRGGSSDILIEGKRAPVTVRTDASGQATFTFSVRPDTSVEYTISVDDAQGLEPDEETGTLSVKVLPVIPERISIAFYNSNGAARVSSIDAGEDVEIRVSVLDEFDLNIPGLEDYLELVVPDGAFSLSGTPPGDTLEEIREALQWSTATGSDDDEYYFTDQLTAAKVGSQPVTVRLNVGGNVISATRNLTINPGDADHVIVVEAEDIDLNGGEITLTRGRSQKVTLQVVDAWNNPVRSGRYEVRFDSNKIIVREDPTREDVTELSMGPRKTVYLLAARADDDDTLTITLVHPSPAMGDGTWELEVTVK